MILQVIKDVTPLSAGMLVSALSSYKYSQEADIFNRLTLAPFEESNVVRVNGVLGTLPKENFKICTVEITNPKHPLYKKKFEISSIIMEDLKTRQTFEFVNGVLDPLSIKSIVIDTGERKVELSLGDTQLSFIDNAEIEEFKAYLRYVDREEYEETFSREWEVDEVETEEDKKIAEEKVYFSHNTGTMTLERGTLYEVIKFMKKNPDTGEYFEVPQSQARVAQVLANGNFVTVLLRNGNIIRK